MNIWLAARFPLLLLLCAVGLMVLHVRTWRRSQQGELDADGLNYRRRQFRRRMQSSAMLGLLAIAIFAGQLFPERLIHNHPMLVIIFWAGVLFILGWVGLLALADIWATKHHFGRRRQAYLVEQAKLQAELHHIRATRGNGKPKKGNQGPETED